MKPRKKNSFFTFICAFCPGAAEMYMGFMKSGLSILAIFILPIFITGALQGSDYIVMLSALVYVVGFFHAINYATSPEEEFKNIEDKYIWDELLNINSSDLVVKLSNKWVAVFIIYIGGCGVWALFRDVIMNIVGNIPAIRTFVYGVPRLVLSVLVIVFGVMLIKGKKKEIKNE